MSFSLPARLSGLFGMISPQLSPSPEAPPRLQPFVNSNVSLQDLLQAPDGVSSIVRLPEKSSLSFEVDGVLFNAWLYADPKAPKLVIWGVLGYLPYSVTNARKRKALVDILEGSRGLKNVHFGLDSLLRIVVRGTFPLPQPIPPHYLFEPLSFFIQEAMPFITLIGEHL